MGAQSTCFRKWQSIFVVVALFFLSGLFLGQRAKAADYDIRQYHVDITVSETNVYTIQETIKVYFVQSRHGIYRSIPLKNKVTRADGSTDQIMASIADISCGSEEFSVSRDGNNCQIKIGDKNTTIIGEKIYHISYQYDMGEDVLKDADEFYYNVIGMGWDATIQNVTFSIKMPKAFDKSLLGMVYGKAGSVETEGLTYFVEGNQITGALDNDIVLRWGEGVTVRLELPEGYFAKKNEIPWLAFATFLLGIITVMVSYWLWYTYGKDDPVVETVEFYAPGGLNSAEAAYVYSGTLSNQGVVSLVVYLAQKGYIDISEEKTGRKTKFVLTKKRDYDGMNPSEKMFMSGLFKTGNVVTKKDLEDKFYRTVGDIISQITTQFKYKIYFASSLNKNKYLYLLLVVVFLAAGFMPVYRYSFSALEAILYPILAGVLFTVAFSVLWNVQSSIAVRIFSFAMSMMMLGAMSIALMGEVILYASLIYQIALGFAVFVCAVTTFFAAFMSKRTPYGNEMLGKLTGFKRFLETAEKNRLEVMVAQDPQYFYDILPYTYALGVSDKWMKKFESIAIEPPEWHHSYNNGYFNVVAFHNFMNTTMSSVNTAMTSSPSSSSGGGVSGGGSGGGGGGSW